MNEKSISWSKVVKKAVRDPKFRQDLLSNPRATLEKEYGITLPKDVNFVVHEQSPQTIHLVLPPVKPLPASANRIGDDDEEQRPRRIGDDDEEQKSRRIGDDDEEHKPRRIGDDDEEHKPRRIGDDDEEHKPRRIGDDDEELKPRRIGDDDEEHKPRRIGDDDEEQKS